MADKTLLVQILVDSNDAQRGVDQVAQKTDGMGQAFRNAAALAATWLAGRALGAVKQFVDDSVRAYSDLEQSTGSIEAVFGQFAGKIEDAAQAAADAVGLSQSAYQTLAANIGGQLQNLGFSQDAAVTKTQELIEAGADLAATYGGTTADAVMAISAMLRGEREQIERYAISVKEADVNARTMALGLDTSTSAAEKNSEAIASLDLLMEQAAKTQGMFASEADTVAGATERANAQIENQKALVGESLVPFKQLTTELQLLGAQTLGILATGFQQLTGQIDDTDAAIQEFQIHMGRQADDAESALTIIKEYGVSVSDLVPRLQLSTQELQRLRDADEEWLASLGFTKDEISDLADVVDSELNRAFAEMEDQRLSRYVPAVEEAAEATEELKDESVSAADAIRDIGAATREASDPVFGYYQATQDLADAQAEYNAAVEEFGEDSPEAIAAAGKIADANSRIQDTVTKIGTVGVPAAMDALKKLGVPESVITKFANDRARIEEIFRNMVLRVGVSVPTLHPTRPRDGGVGWESDTVVHYARGGIAAATPGGQAARIAEAGRAEAVTPLSAEGLRPWAQALLEEMGGTRSGESVILQISAARSEPLDGWAIIEALQKVNQTAGPIPIEIRT